MVFVLYTVVLEGADPGVDDAARVMAVPADRFDVDFGVIAVDPGAKRYAVRVDAEALGELGEEVTGPFADPRIEPFGPPEAGDDP